MAIILCKSCGKRVSSQWPECPGCGTVPGEKGSADGGKRRRFNPAPHYLIGTTLATIGALTYGAQLMGRAIDPRVMTVAMVMIALGACWYAAARLLAALR